MEEFKIGNGVVNTSKFWHSADGKGKCSLSVIDNLKGVIIENLGKYRTIADTEFIYMIKWSNGETSSKSHSQIKLDPKEIRENKIKKLLADEK